LPIASAPARSARVGSAFAWEVAKRTTERDREIAWLLYRQKIFTTDQLRLLFFSSLRRCQDRLLWLHRHRVIDRFYPGGPFSLGKPQAHWLLDEVGAHLVAARLGRERKSLAWDRQQDFHEHAHLAHRLECNAFVCGVIAASLDTEDVWVGAWGLGWEAIKQPWPSFGGYEGTKPDAGFSLSTPYGLVVIALEWDRATEPMTTLLAKIARYGTTPPRGWQPAVVLWILANEAYVGRVHWREQSFPGLHEPLIDADTFERAQALLKERGGDWTHRAARAEFLLSGLLRCGRCRRAYVGMSAKGNGGTYHYACSGRQKLGRKGCDGDRLSKEKLEAAIFSQLTAIYRDGGLIRDAIEEAAARQDTDHDALTEQRASLAKEIGRAERAIERYQDAFEAGNLDPTRFNERLTALDVRLDALRGQDQALARELAADIPAIPDTAALRAVADQLGQVIATGDPDRTKALLRTLIAELRVNSRSEILPTYRVGAPVVCAQTSSMEPTGIEPVSFRQLGRDAGIGDPRLPRGSMPRQTTYVIPNSSRGVPAVVTRTAAFGPSR
jgi:Replication-relaxation/Recombinase zinc beta ribbon domain/Recombinase